MDVKSDLVAMLDADSVLSEQPLAAYTSLRVGGPAEYMVLPRDYSQVAAVLKYCSEKQLDWYVLGKGTNLLVSDRGLPGVVICIEKNLAEIRVAGNRVIVQAGASLPRVSNIAQASGLSGLEFAEGIPGTVGGAVVMNAGAYGGEMKDVLVRVLAVSPQGQFLNLAAKDLDLGYRTSVFQANHNVVLEVEMELVPGDREEIRRKMVELSRLRREKQPLDKASAGSTFKRPAGYYAGQLIDQCSLRGYTLGGAMVSEKHCGFIINANKATAQEIYDLIQHIQEQVKARHGVELQPEVRIWGRFRQKQE